MEKGKKEKLVFEPIKYEDDKKEQGILEIYKNQDWDNLVPLILDAVDHTKSKEEEEIMFSLQEEILNEAGIPR